MRRQIATGSTSQALCNSCGAKGSIVSTASWQVTSSSKRRAALQLAAAAANLAPPETASFQEPRHPSWLKLSKRSKSISWHKWEKLLYHRLAQQEQEQSLLAPGADDDWYFSYWDCPDSHLAVLQDTAYQEAWSRAVAAAQHLIQDKVVLDVGCGLGMLPMLAAKAGAKHVYAVEASTGAAELARKVIAVNGLSNKITVITGRAELVDLPVKRVDVIMSDWMGNMLLHDGLLPTLLRVRDRWLAPGGIILPDAAQLHVIGMDDRQYLAEQSKLWAGKPLGPGDGFDFKPVLNAVIKHPRVDSVSRRTQLVTDTQQLLSIDVYKQPLDLGFKRPFTLTAQRSERVSGLLTYFNVAFTCRGQLGPASKPVTFSTSPLAPSTSWLQTVFSFPRAIKMEPGQQLAGSVTVQPVGLPVGRMLDVDVDVDFQGLKAKVAYQLRR